MEFVVEVLVKVFQKSAAERQASMLDVHEKGRGTCGIFTYDVAVTNRHRFTRWPYGASSPQMFL
jgi:ATP-dependent Clp protease adaptor protein ClpS